MGHRDKSCGTKTVFKLSDPDGRMNLRRWLEPPDSVAHDNAANIWNGPIDPLTGLPSHPNDPTSTSLETDWVFSGPDDQMEGWGWIRFNQDGWIREVNGNTGERGDIYCTDCCGNTKLLQSTTVNTPADDRGLLDPTPIKAGVYKKNFQQSDFSANQGGQFQFSPTEDGTYANITNQTHEMWSFMPKLETLEIGLCDDIPEGWSTVQPKVPCEMNYLPPAPDTTLTPEQVADIVKQSRPEPIDVLPEAWGNATLDSSLILDRWREVCGFSLAIRSRVQQDSGTGWGGIQILPVAGFQQPKIFPVNGYHFQSTPTQLDSAGGQGGDGATPRGPLMTLGQFGHWSSTRRLYGLFRRDNPIDEYWEVIVEYLED